MSPIRSSLLLGAGDAAAGGFQVSRSLRFSAPDSSYLSQNTSRSPAANTSITFSFWVKLSSLTTDQTFFSSSTGGFLQFTYWGATYGNKIYVYHDSSGLDGYAAKSDGVLRDPSAWYHFLYSRAHNSNGTLYINGVAQSTQSTNTANVDFFADASRKIGSTNTGFRYVSSCVANFQCIDGQALTPSSFTEVSATTGQLIPKAFSGSYGLVADSTGALPIFNTTGAQGAVKGTGTRTDTNSASIVLALPMDGTNGGTSLGDQSAVIKGSGSAKTVTVNGNTNTSTTQSKFYGSSGYFDGTGDYLSVTNSSDFDFGSGNSTLEVWVYPTDVSTARNILSRSYTGGTGNFSGFILSTSNFLETTTQTAWDVTISRTLTVNTWQHLAIVRNSNTWTYYINGVSVGTATVSGSVPTGPSDLQVGRRDGQSEFQGYMSDVRIYKGVAKYTSNFIVPTPNSFYLNFADNSSNTASTLGKDTSGNSNNWTPNNLSVTAGAGNDSMVDTPVSGSTADTGLGGQVTGNYCTLNPLVNFNNSTISNGNLDIVCASVGGQWRTQEGGWGIYGGKFYYEVTGISLGSAGNSSVGFGQIDLSQSGNKYPGKSAGSYGYMSDGGKCDSGSAISYVWASWAAGDVIGVAADLINGTVAFYKNGTLQGSMTGLDITVAYEILLGSASGTASQYSLNAGQRAFAYTAPSGFKALCDTNLPTPVVAKPNTLMDVKLWTGTGATQSITGVGFNPDFLWIKSRSGSGYNHQFTVSPLDQVTSLNADGFTLGSDSASPGALEVNELNQTYVGWLWDAGTTTVSNTQGSITSQVRANATAGFSVVTYTGNNTAGATVGHGLGVAPKMIIVKSRGVENWGVYHHTLGTTSGLLLNSTTGAIGSAWWNSTDPTSSVFSLSTSSGITNSSGVSYVAYCFTPVVGYSSFGSYTGNGSADGPFVFTGMRPRFLMIKRTDTGGSANYDWMIYDTARDTYNLSTKKLTPNSSVIEGQDSDAAATDKYLDILSNGFKIKVANAGINGSPGTFIYAAFAESPFQYARAR
jgi:hypothetical protein